METPAATAEAVQLLHLPIDAIFFDHNQPRKEFPREELNRLTASIQARGLLSPLRVTRDEVRGVYRLISGESRLHACRYAGIHYVPCILVEGNPGEVDTLTDQLTENVVRASLKPMELARGLEKLKALKGCTWQDLATELGLSGASVTRAVKLLSLPDILQGKVERGVLNAASAYELTKLEGDEAELVSLAEQIMAKGMSRDDVAELVKQRREEGRKPRPGGKRLSCKLDGVSVTFNAGDASLTWETLLAALERLRRDAKKLAESGEDVFALAAAKAG